VAQRKTILVIDDDPDVHFFCRSVLEAEGYQVETAASGAAGIKLAEELSPDLIILDIMMERIDTGYTVVEKIGGRFPILIFSSMLNASDEAFDPSAVAYRDVVRKPIDAQTLLAKVRKQLP